MAVAKSATSAVSTDGGASSTTGGETASSITVGASDTFLLLVVEADTSTPGTIAAHWDSAGTNQAMTLIGSITDSAGATPMTLAVFGLVNPTPGAKKFTWSFSGQATNVNAYHFSISFTGTDTTSVANATEAFQTNSGSAANATVTSAASIPSGDMAVAAYNNIPGYTNAFTSGTNPGDGGTAIGKNESLTTNMAGEYYSGAGSTVAASATQNSSSEFTALIVGIKASAAPVVVGMPRGGRLFAPRKAFGPARGLTPTRAYVPSTLALTARFLSTTAARAGASFTGFVPATPTLVQHVGSTVNDNNGIIGNGFQFNLPNNTLAGNCLVLTVSYPYSATRTVSVSDSTGDTWPSAALTAGTASTSHMNTKVFVLPNASAGLHTLTVTLDAAVKPFQYTLTEYRNVDTASPVDGTQSAVAAGSSANAGSFTPTTNNDVSGGHLIVSHAISDDTVGTVVANQASAMSATNSANLLHADNTCTIPSVSAYSVQAANGAINPGFAITQSTGTNFVVSAVALKAASAGQAPAPGIRIVRVLHTTVQFPATGNNVLLFPTDGNLRVATTAAGNNLNVVNSVTDSDGNTYSARAQAGNSQIWDAVNQSANNALTLTLNLNASEIQFSLHLFDVTGADAVPFMNASGVNGAAPASGTAINDFPDHTPNANVAGLTIVQTGMGTAGPEFGFASGAPAGAVFDNVYYGANFTGSISGSVLTVSAVAIGQISVGDLVQGSGVTSATITSFGTGTGGIGTYNLGSSQTVSSRAMWVGMTDQDRMDNADPLGHVNFSTNTPQTWNWLLAPAGYGSTAFATAVSYKAASSPGSGAGMVFRAPRLFTPTGGPRRGLRSAQAYPAPPFVSVALSAWCAAEVVGRGFAQGAAAVSVRFLSEAKGSAGASANASLLARGNIADSGRASPQGALPVTARGGSETSARATATGSAAIASRAASVSKGRAVPQGAAAMSARSMVEGSGRPASSGVLGLLARSAAAFMGRGLASGATIFVAALSLFGIKGRSNVQGTVPLAGHGTTASQDRSSASLATTLAARTGITSKGRIGPGAYALALMVAGLMAAKGRSGASGVVGIVARGASALMARGLASGATIFVTAISLLALKGRSSAQGTALLAAHGQTATSGRDSASGAVGLSARIKSAARGSGSIIFGAFLSAVTRVAATGRAASNQVAALTSRLATQSKDAANPSGKATLTARIGAQAKSQSKIAATGFLGVLTTMGSFALKCAAALKSTLLNPNLIATSPARHLIATAATRQRVVTAVSNGMSSIKNLMPPIDASVEQETVTFDFGPIISAGVTITSRTISCAAAVGKDLLASTRLLGSSSLIASPATGQAGAAVVQLVGNMVADVTYRLQCVITTSDGQTLSLWTHITCVNPK